MFSNFFSLAERAPEVLASLKSQFLQGTCISQTASDTLDTSTPEDDDRKLKNPPPDNEHKTSNRKYIYAVIGALAGPGALGVAVVCIWLWRRRKNKLKT